MTDGILQDISGTGKERPWREHKVANEYLAMAYEDVKPDKAARLRDCSTRLTFEKQDTGKLKLAGAFFCRVRLCPICTWRRSLKVAAQMNAIMDAIKADKPQAYIMLTLTQKNCQPEELDTEITRVLAAFSNLTKRKTFQKAVNGFYRAMEVTHNISGDTYHPHIHAVLAVNPSYFKSRDYLGHDAWVTLWQEVMKLDYAPTVDVRRIKGDTASAVAEVAKYAVKSGDYIIPDDWEMTVNTVRTLDAALHNRRFIAFGGVFKEFHKKLHLDDADAGDLLHVEADEKPAYNPEKIIHFAWYSGYRQYRAEP